MSKRKKSDIVAIGDAYSDILNKVKATIVSENKKIATNQIGDVELKDGGPQEKGGFKPAKIDIKDKNKKENMYNVDKLSDDCGCEEDEEFLQEIKKSAKDRLNTFMIKKSVFDTLYESMLNDEDGEMSFDSMEQADADALIDDIGSEGGDEVTVEVGGIKLMLSRSDAEALKSSLESQLEDELGGEEYGETEDEEYGDEMSYGDEDEEELGHAGVNAKEPDMGKSNKVGSVKPTSKTATSKVTSNTNTTEYGHALHGAKQPDMGKNNKVGNLKPSSNMFD